jgi:serine/threonine-protein kinase
VLEQFPEPGHSTKAGRTVKLIVSKGARTAVVPDMAGSSQRRAQLAVRASRLEIRETASVNHPRVPLGRVIAQDPPPGAERFPGDPVSLLLSAGPAHHAFVMPALTGTTVADARRMLERAGFTRIRVRCPECEGDDRRSRIRDQRPLPGERVTTDDRVVLSAGPWSMEITR